MDDSGSPSYPGSHRYHRATGTLGRTTVGTRTSISPLGRPTPTPAYVEVRDRTRKGIRPGPDSRTPGRPLQRETSDRPQSPGKDPGPPNRSRCPSPKPSLRHTATEDPLRVTTHLVPSFRSPSSTLCGRNWTVGRVGAVDGGRTYKNKSVADGDSRGPDPTTYNNLSRTRWKGG